MGKLIEAVQQNDIPILKELLKEKYKTSSLINEEKLDDGRSALHIAAQYGFTEIMELLIEAGAKINQTGGLGLPPLWYAVKHGQIKAAKLLLNKEDSNVDQPLEDGNTLLSEAAYRGRVTAIETLLKIGANIDQINNDGETPLHRAIRTNQVEAVNSLLKNKTDIKKSNNNGESPLDIAVQYNRLEIIKALIESGADINTKTNDGKTVIDFAKEEDNKLLVNLFQQPRNKLNLLLDKIVNSIKPISVTELPKTDPFPPLIDAIVRNAIAEVRNLLDGEVYQNSPLINKENDYIPLYIAAKEGHTKIVEILLNVGAIGDQSDNDGWTPLHVAALNSHVTTIEALLKRKNKVNIDQPNHNGATPLYIAACCGKEKAVEALLKGGAKIEQPNDNGATPLYIAVQNNQVKVVEVLLIYKANVKIKTKSEKTLLNIAEEKGYTAIVNLLEQAINPASYKKEEPEINQQLHGINQKLKKIEKLTDIDEKEKKSNFLEAIKDSSNAQIAYRVFQTHLTSIYTSASAVKGGRVSVNSADGALSIISGALGLIQNFADYIPIIDKVGKVFGAAKAVAEKIGEIRQINVADSIVSLGTRKEVEKEFEKAARKLTEHYFLQYEQIATKDQAKKIKKTKMDKNMVTKLFGKGKEVKEKGLKEHPISPAEKVTAFAIIWMAEEIFNKAHTLEDEIKEKGLATVLVNVVTQQKPPKGVQEIWNTLSENLNIDSIPVLTSTGEISNNTWHPCDFWTLPGIAVENTKGKYEYYSRSEEHVERFGWRLGTNEDIEGLNKDIDDNNQSRSRSTVRTTSVMQQQKSSGLNRSLKLIKLNNKPSIQPNFLQIPEIKNDQINPLFPVTYSLNINNTENSSININENSNIFPSTQTRTRTILKAPPVSSQQKLSNSINWKMKLDKAREFYGKGKSAYHTKNTVEAITFFQQAKDKYKDVLNDNGADDLSIKEAEKRVNKFKNPNGKYSPAKIGSLI